MSQATHSRSTTVPGSVTHLTINLGTASPPASDVPVNRDLQRACDEARSVQKAMAALARSVATLSPADPRHAAAHAAVDLLRPKWQRSIDAACQVFSAAPSDWLAKSDLLASMVERDEMDRVLGGPVVQLASSLADDLLFTHDSFHV